jgi:flap endonuclease-1
MGTNLKNIIHVDEISIKELSGKILAVDSFNILYQFLTTIRQYDGQPLTNSKGKVTSHLSGIFFRTIKLMENNIKLVFVFDGKAPDLKNKERERRKALKDDAQRKYDLAVEQGDIELMRKYATRTTKLTTEMINEAKELLNALGLPIIQAPSEGEAQAAYMAKKGDVYGLISQDTDGLLFESPRLIKNLSISARKKKGATYVANEPEIIDLSKNLNELGIDIDQLIIISILCGTDFNIGGVKGIGPKNALKLVKKFGKDFDTLFSELEWSFDYPWQDVFDVIKNMKIIDNYELKWNNIDKEKVLQIMVDENEFSKERVQKSLDNITKKQAQKGLSEFF